MSDTTEGSARGATVLALLALGVYSTFEDLTEFFGGEKRALLQVELLPFYREQYKKFLRHMARALLEGVAFRLRSVKDVLEENSIIARQIRASGGFTRSALWLQIISDVMNRPLTVPQWGETSSMGAAFWVLLAIGAVESLEKLVELVHLGESYEPNSSDALLYEQLYRVYQEIYRSSLTPFDQLQTLRPD